QVLEHLHLREHIAGRLIYGGSVRQVLDYVERGEVDAGVVYATDAMQSGAKVRVVATADEASHRPIRYVAAVVRATPRAGAAASFLRFLTAEQAQRAFAARGFVPPATQPTTAP